ncbi:hypothetical protein O0L34_g12847 [Tuta absoluta]|nr:hypothetical protein O0L34_g12847 [Tuta absoluta]
MSWPQRAGGTAPAHPPPQPQRPGPGAQLPQGYNNQQNMYPNYQGAQPPPGNTQQYWAGQQPQFNQQYGQVYQQQDYGNNANQLYQQTPQYNQNYASQGYTDTQQQYPQNYYPNQATQQQGYQTQPKTDSWEDNWDWGWDEASKQAQQATLQNQAPAPAAQPQQQQVYNNANVIEESFASTDTWNWSMEDKKESKENVPAPKQEPAVLPNEKPVENQSMNQHPPRSSSNASSHGHSEEVRSLSDREVVKERLPNLALGKRIHLENLTPQWSIESQMSQESSDGPQTHSEGTYRSDNQSRNSSKSSPGVNTENSNFNYPQSTEDYTPSTEWSRHSNEDTLVANNQASSRRESHDELTNSLKEMNIANRENPAPEHSLTSKESVQAPPSISPANLPPPVSSFMLPPTMPLPTMPPAPPVTAGAGMLPPPTSSAILPPPTNFPQSSSSTNPFKQSGPFSHKKVPSASPSLQSFPPTSSTNLTSPNVVNKVSQSQHRLPVGFGANLETTPDNSERPDQPQMSAFRPAPIPQQVPDNLEVAPQNDRNEYLQTAHLSSSDYGENTDFSRNVPPPGLRRMVVGQQESEYGQNLNISGDEPPPGLARMVPGQQTEADNRYNQAENYMERHVDGQLTDSSGRPYRQADGQQTPENYSQPPSRGSDRRPIGLDRMVPGEPSNDEYPQYQAGNYSASSSEHRVVTGVDHDYPMPTDAGPTDIREQNVDGSDYSEQTPRAVQRNVIGARDVNNDVTQDFSPLPEDQQREITMEGENLQDLSIIPAPDMSYSREQTFDGADNATDGGIDRKTDLSDSIEHPTTSSRRQSLNRGTSGDESDRDRAFKSSPRRDRDKHKSTRDRDRDRERDKEGGRYSRGDRKFDRDREDRRSGRDKDRPEKDWDRREESPHSRRHRRGTRSRRYETEDTDYYSDKERERRAYREGSYASKPPRPDESRRHDRSRRYNTIERDRRPDDDRRRDRHREERHRSERHRDDRDRYEARYRDIDPTRKHGNLRVERDDEERRRGELYSSASRPDSRDGPGAVATDEDLNDTLASESRRRDRRARREPRPDPYYDSHYASAGYPDAYSMQRQQYEYYERLRASDPHAYLQLYKQIMAGRAPALVSTAGQPAYAGMYGYEPRAEDRGSVHSGRSSTNGLKGNDTYYGAALGGARTDHSSLRGVPSLRTDVSDRELNTDASLNLHLEESTVRSERMTPFKFSTAHVKGDISSRNVVVVRPSYPVDGLPATVHIMSLASALARDPMAQELAAYPGPLIKGVTHKMSVIEYCQSRGRTAARAAPRDHIGYVLVWELLALLLRQNGVVVGTDIAELLMKNTKEYEYKTISPKNSTHNESRRGSSLSGQEERAWSPEQPSLSTSDLTPQDQTISPSQPAVDEKAALDKLREYLTYGNRQEALEWAMSCGLWGHAMQLAVCMERRARANVAARFLAALSRTDPLHTLYSHLQARQPPAATVSHAMQLAVCMERRARANVAARFLAALSRTDPLHTLYSHLQARQPPAATVSHAMQLAVCMERRARANVAARFLAALSRTDPLHTLYSHLQARQPPAATVSHAMQLAVCMERRARANVAARFLAALSRTDPLHTLYSHLQARQPPAATVSHAMQLAVCMERRARANVAARFLAALSRTDPLHTLYSHLQARQPPAATVSHAMQLAVCMERRARANVAARFLAALSRTDPLHTLYSHLQARQPPAATVSHAMQLAVCMERRARANVAARFLAALSRTDPLHTLYSHLQARQPPAATVSHAMQLAVCMERRARANVAARFLAALSRTDPLHTLYSHLQARQPPAATVSHAMQLAVCMERRARANVAARFLAALSRTDPLHTLYSHLQARQPPAATVSHAMQLAVCMERRARANVAARFLAALSRTDPLHTLYSHLQARQPPAATVSHAMQLAVCMERRARANVAARFLAALSRTDPLHTLYSHLQARQPPAATVSHAMQLAVCMERRARANVAARFLAALSRTDPLHTLYSHLQARQPPAATVSHAMQLAVCMERRARANVAARFLAALSRTDPLHTLYSHLQARQPPAATVSHAMQLAVCMERRARANVAARFLAALSRTDPLHTLYSHLQARQPPAATVSHAMQLAVCMERRARANVAARFLAALSRTDPLHTLYSHLQARQPPAATVSHAMQLAVCMERRARANVAARFLAALSRTDPLHTLYSHLQARQPPAATCVTDERWGDWRPHAAIMLANTSVKPDQDRRTLTQLGDSLLSRGLLYSAQFCYVSAGVGFSRHPLAPLQPDTGTTAQPRLALLLGDARATSLAHLATNQAIFATEIYEYALSLNQDYVINELQVYKLLLATRLIDVGQYERALGYTEAASRAVTRHPRDYSPRLVQQLATLADSTSARSDTPRQRRAPSPATRATTRHAWCNNSPRSRTGTLTSDAAHRRRSVRARARIHRGSVARRHPPPARLLATPGATTRHARGQVRSLATRLIDVGQYERALGYTEAASRAVTRHPRDYSPRLVQQLATLADSTSARSDTPRQRRAPSPATRATTRHAWCNNSPRSRTGTLTSDAAHRRRSVRARARIHRGSVARRHPPPARLLATPVATTRHARGQVRSLATRLIDVGQYERALGYTEAASRAVTRHPRDYSPRLVQQLATLADSTSARSDTPRQRRAPSPATRATTRHAWCNNSPRSRTGTLTSDAAHRRRSVRARARIHRGSVARRHPPPARLLATPGATTRHARGQVRSLATRLIDVGQYERALGYTEAASRAVTRHPRDYSPRLVQQLATLADSTSARSDTPRQRRAPSPATRATTRHAWCNNSPRSRTGTLTSDAAHRRRSVRARARIHRGSVARRHPPPARLLATPGATTRHARGQVRSLATRLIDVGQYERALGYTEAASRAVTRHPRDYSPRLVQQLATLADRLKYHEPALQEDPPLVEEGAGSGEPSPRHHQQWLHEVQSVADMLTAEREASVSTLTTPQHNYYAPPAQTAWGEQTQQQEYQPPQPQSFEPEEAPDYSHYYQQQPPPPTIPEHPQPPPTQDTNTTQSYEEWGRQEETQQQGYDNTYWRGDGLYSYGERGGSRARAPAPRPAPPPAAAPAGRQEPPVQPAPAASTLRRRAVHPTPEPPPAAFLPRRAPPARAPQPPQPPATRLRTISRSSADSSGSERARRPVSHRPISDLDIQIAHSPQLGMPAPPAPLIPPARRNKRCGSVIGNTVDSWARSTVHVRDGTYKPLVFGGTYPIEVPASPPEVQRPLGVKPQSQVAAVKPRQLTEVQTTLDPKTHRQELRKTIERSLDRFEAILARREMSKDARRQAFSKRVVNTFDIDEPMTSTDPPKESTLKEKDAKYYVSGPKTFNIDEPVSFI